MDKKYSAVLFDFDETLVNIGKSFSDYTEKFYKDHELKLDPRYKIFERPYQQIYHDILDGKITLDPQLHEKFMKMKGLKLEEAEWMEGAIETIKKLRKRDYKLGIITNGTTERILGTLHYQKVEDLFDVLICREDVQNRKPHPEPIQKALERLNIISEETLYVGNHQTDIESGKAASVDNVFLANNKMYYMHVKPQLDENPPDYTVEKLDELLEICS
ncbi:HAD-IIIA family hydrolase [Candidatus Parcubacteria bacterium]|nr:MAG: HAD-IIIA family hydrolase [Candidatus Parcubacteria bacterium]